MNILKKIKFIFAIFLICCLFLPLSQCTYSTDTPDQTQQSVVQERYVFQSTQDVESWLAAAAVLAPFIVLLGTFRSKHKIKSTLTMLFFSIAAFLMLFNATLLADKLLIGGYLGLISSLALIILCAIELVINLSGLFKAKIDSSDGVV